MAPQHFTSQILRQLHVYTLELLIENANGQIETTTLTLPLAPQRQTFVEPSRTSANQTLGGYYLEEWGAGIKPLTLSGHTGFAIKAPGMGVPAYEAQGKSATAMDGYQTFLALVKMFRDYYRVAQENSRRKEDEGRRLEMYAYIWEEDEAWRVVPSGPDALRRERNAQAPLRFDYSLSLLGVENLRERPTPLNAGLLAPPGMEAVMQAMNQAQQWLTGVLNTPILGGISINSAAGTIAAAAASLREKVASIRQMVAGTQAGLAAALGPVMSAASEARSLMKEVTAAAEQGLMAIKDAINVARNARQLYCNLQNLGEIIKSATGLGSVMAAWNAAKAEMVSC